MARIIVRHGIDDLASDLAGITTRPATDLPPVVRRNVEKGQRLAQQFAREASGPHGRLYYKRITSGMTGPLTGEFGPTGDVVGNAVGAGWRNGAANLDQAKAADIVGPAFADEVGDEAEGWFW